ncbi:SDR family NAD(P)-dependent oxidoreductase [Streptomyces javensis]|uniref:SDR family NAD(P)-dependent oxidoreductase n=1 Tax=Streptomyces javensis TaxID=114698 RepID=UPI0033DC4345
MDLELKDKTAIVTGSARGLGAATARRLAREGARVVVTDIDGQGAEATAKELTGDGHRAIAVRAVAVSGTDVDALVAAATEEHRGPLTGQRVVEVSAFVAAPLASSAREASVRAS